MLKHHHEGKRVVYGVRLERKVDVLPNASPQSSTIG